MDGAVRFYIVGTYYWISPWAHWILGLTSYDAVVEFAIQKVFNSFWEWVSTYSMSTYQAVSRRSSLGC